MRLGALFVVLATAVLTALVTAYLAHVYFGYWFESYKWMVGRYVYAAVACLEDLHTGATALRHLDEFFGLERSNTLPHALRYRVVTCVELGTVPPVIPDMANWMPPQRPIP